MTACIALFADANTNSDWFLKSQTSCLIFTRDSMYWESTYLVFYTILVVSRQTSIRTTWWKRFLQAMEAINIRFARHARNKSFVESYSYKYPFWEKLLYWTLIRIHFTPKILSEIFILALHWRKEQRGDNLPISSPICYFRQCLDVCQ